MTTYCKFCEEEITFSDDYTSESGKKIPLDADTDEPHRCKAWEEAHRRYKNCFKGCGGEIYFDQDSRTDSGKWIPVDKYTNEPHDRKGGDCKPQADKQEDDAD